MIVLVGWDKQKGNFSLADGELAWTSFKTSVAQFTYRWHGFLQQKSGDLKIEYTQLKNLLIYTNGF
jgi:hypothetical protein